MPLLNASWQSSRRVRLRANKMKASAKRRYGVMAVALLETEEDDFLSNFSRFVLGERMDGK